MASQTRSRRKPGGQADQTGPPEPAPPNVGVALLHVPPGDTDRHSFLLAHHLDRPQLLTEEREGNRVEPEETLIPDARNGLMPAQMVDQKLLALLHSGNPGLFIQATGRPEDPRRMRGRQNTLASLGWPDAALKQGRLGEPPEPEPARACMD